MTPALPPYPQTPDAARAAVLRLNPDWSAVRRYSDLGLSHAEIRRLTGKGESTVRRIKRELRALGLLPPLNLKRLRGAALRSAQGTLALEGAR